VTTNRAFFFLLHCTFLIFRCTVQDSAVWTLQTRQWTSVQLLEQMLTFKERLCCIEWETGDSTWFPEPRAVPLFWITQPETGKWHTLAVFKHRSFCAVQVSAAVAYYANCIQDGDFFFDQRVITGLTRWTLLFGVNRKGVPWNGRHK